MHNQSEHFWAYSKNQLVFFSKSLTSKIRMLNNSLTYVINCTYYNYNSDKFWIETTVIWDCICNSQYIHDKSLNFVRHFLLNITNFGMKLSLYSYDSFIICLTYADIHETCTSEIIFNYASNEKLFYTVLMEAKYSVLIFSVCWGIPKLPKSSLFIFFLTMYFFHYKSKEY